MAEPTLTDSLSDVCPRLLRCFVVLAEELHFGLAADRLFVAQPALSRTIKRLERLLGRELFTRTTRLVSLTPAGAALVEPAREVLRRLEAFTAELDAHQGRLRVGLVPDTDTAALILDRLARLVPDLQVEEHVLRDGDELRAVREGLVDVTVCRPPATEQAGLRACVIRLDPLLVAVLGRQPGHRRSVDVTRRSVAVGAGDDRLDPLIAEYEAQLGCRLQRVPVPAGTGTEAFTLRRAGVGAFMTLASRGVRLDSTAPTAPAVPVQAYYPWAVVHRREARSLAIRAFVNAAQEVSQARRWMDTSTLPGRPYVAGGSTERVAA